MNYLKAAVLLMAALAATRENTRKLIEFRGLFFSFGKYASVGSVLSLMYRKFQRPPRGNSAFANCISATPKARSARTPP